MSYQVPFAAKTFICKDCNTEVTNLRWKSISNNINKGSQYKCDTCWDKFDKEFDTFCIKKLQKNLTI